MGEFELHEKHQNYAVRAVTATIMPSGQVYFSAQAVRKYMDDWHHGKIHLDREDKRIAIERSPDEFNSYKVTNKKASGASMSFASALKALDINLDDTVYVPVQAADRTIILDFNLAADNRDELEQYWDDENQEMITDTGKADDREELLAGLSG